MKQNTQALSQDSPPFGWLWLAFFAYAAIVALLVQLVLLPYVFPQLHAGNGLLVGGDWLGFHRMAVEVAQRIRTEGWSAWEFRSYNEGLVGIVGAWYALTTSQPWTLIPLNAGLHATGALILLRIMLFFVSSWRVALWCVLPFLIFPSAMLWYTQIHKDGYFIVGILAFIYGWIAWSSLETWKRSWWLPLKPLVYVLLGTLFVWIVRPYGVELLQGVGMGLALVLTVAFAVWRKKAALPWNKVITGFLLCWLSLWSIGFILSDGTGGYLDEPLNASGEPAPAAGEMPQSPPLILRIPWQTTTGLPAFLDGKFYGIALVRERSRTYYPDAASNIDVDTNFRKALDVLAYMPRAAQIALLAPFPNQWFKQGSRASTDLMRRVSVFEMGVVYLCLLLLVYALWRWRARLELWVLFLFCSGMMMIFGLSITNVGSLYRIRYGFLMTLVAVGIAAGLSAWQERRRGLKPL